MSNPFFENKGPIKIDELLNSVNIKNKFDYTATKIFDVKDLVTASNTDITFFHSKKYENVALNTKAAYCITTKQLSKILPKSCKPIEV
jgi:UDP-3-O-[3-hydroxymyristoyl] glucosamine N-acyltransferase